MQSLNPLIPNFSVLKREYLANSLTRNSGQALNWHKYCTRGLKYISVSRFEVLFSESRLKTNKQKKDGWRLNFSPQAVGGAAGSPLPQGLNHLPFIPPALLSGHLAEAPVPAILYCAAGEKNETAQVCLPALERLWSPSGWSQETWLTLTGSVENKIQAGRKWRPSSIFTLV